MSEGHAAGVQRLSSDMLHIGIIKIIADERKAEIFHMNTNLVGAACFKIKGNKAVPICFVYNLIVCDGGFAVFKIYGAFDNSAGFSGKGSSDYTRRRRDMSPDNCQIFPVGRFGSALQ